MQTTTLEKRCPEDINLGSEESGSVNRSSFCSCCGTKGSQDCLESNSLQKNSPDNSSEETRDSGFKGLSSKGRVRDNISSMEGSSKGVAVGLIIEGSSKGDCDPKKRGSGRKGTGDRNSYGKVLRNGKSGEMVCGDSKIMKVTHEENSTRKTKSGDRFKILPEEPQPKYRKLEKEKSNDNQTEEKGRVGQKIIEKREADVSVPEQVSLNVEEDANKEEELLRDSVTPSIKLFVFNIVLPTVDIFLDITLILKLFKNGFWGSGTIVVTGIVTNFIFTSLAWWRMESANQKKWSWIFLLLQLWPQLRAFQVGASIIKLQFGLGGETQMSNH